MSASPTCPTLAPDLAVGDLGSLRALLSGRRTRGRLDARLNTDTQDTLLTWAARHGQAEAVRLLLEAGASAGGTTGGGASALYIACQYGHLECVRLLQQAGAAVNHSLHDGFTPLIMACQKGHVDIVRLLLKAGAAIGRKEQEAMQQETPVRLAEC